MDPGLPGGWIPWWWLPWSMMWIFPLGMLVVMVVFLYLFLVRGLFRSLWHPQSPASGGSESARKIETKVKKQG